MFLAIPFAEWLIGGVFAILIGGFGLQFLGNRFNDTVKTTGGAILVAGCAAALTVYMLRRSSK